jgi:hypothetical protein
MHAEPIVIAVALGPHVAALTCRINGRLAAAINTRTRTDPVMRTEAGLALLGAGVDAAHAMGAINGVRR